MLEVKPYSTSSARTGSSGGGQGGGIHVLLLTTSTLYITMYIGYFGLSSYQLQGSFAPSAKRSRGEPRDPEDEVTFQFFPFFKRFSVFSFFSNGFLPQVMRKLFVGNMNVTSTKESVTEYFEQVWFCCQKKLQANTLTS